MAATAPGIVFEQGGRSFVATAFPLRYVSERVRIDSAKRGSDPALSYNRPLIPEHHKAIQRYLLSEPGYFLPGLSLAVSAELRCHVTRTSSSVKLGIMVLPVDLLYNCTDGQHRTVAVRDAVKEAERLGEDAIAITLVVEHDLAKIHDDFYHASLTKAIPASLLTVFNRRDRLAGLVREISDEVPVFKDRIEKITKTTGKSAVNLFTLNQLRAGVAELLTGNSSQANVQLIEETAARLRDDEAYAEHKRLIQEFYEMFTSANPQWSGVLASGDPATATIDTSALRDEFLSCTGTGLIVISRVGYAIRGYPTTERAGLVKALGADIDWSRSSDFWAGTVVTQRRVVSQRGPIESAVIRTKQKLGIALTKAEEARLRRLEPVAA
jgi:DGQHR domain-containing protein